MSSDDALCAACGTPRAQEDADAAEGPAEDVSTLEGVSVVEDPALEEPTLEGGAGPGAPEGDEPPRRRAEDVEASDGGPDEPPSVPAGTWASTTESDTPPPAAAFEREPDTRRVRRVPSDDADGARAESRPVRTRARGDAMARARGRGLAVAPARQEELEDHDDEPRAGRVVAFPAPAAQSAAADAAEARSASATASSSGLRANLAPAAAAAPGPPPRWLASELLREPAPTEPYGWTSRAIATAGGIAGAAASLVLGRGGPDLGMAALFAALAGLAIVPVPFSIRSGGFAIVASIGLSVATWARIGGMEGEAIGLATMGTTLLAAAQLLRSIQRRSRFARAAMLLGLAVTGSWLALDGGLAAMVVQGDSLDAWLGPFVRASLMVVLALSLLAFLDESGTSGTQVWPWLVLGWSALEAVSAIAITGTHETLATVATPVFSAIAALGWMQLWATTPGLGAREPARAAKGDG